MATSEQEMQADPITAALPPNSDYITFLTILEYQLTPDRLPTLTAHLVNDDGTLAKEIGWDLVKLILPLLESAPTDAAKCLEVVARRGNPREVVLRVAEALEFLGTDDDGTESEVAREAGPDELPTLKGEAQRIHLGEMRLHGMHPSPTRSPTTAPSPGCEQQQSVASAVSDTSQLQFSTLLTMLGLLHARIQTQFPSRFLANSLPAALGAYRRIPITPKTTTAFLALLGKMSGKQRPTLPPRSSTASVPHLQSAKMHGTEVYAPLPDPEGKSEGNSEVPSDLERSIVLRLLQAVTLEVLEEYVLANPTSMEWSTRLFEKQSSRKAMPDRQSRSRAWQDDEQLRSRDAMVERFLDLAKNLSLNPENVFRSTNLPLVHVEDPDDALTDISEEKDEDEEPSEFPTSPSQIPYSHLGALFLFLASTVPGFVYTEQDIHPLILSAPDLHHFVNQFVVPTPTLITDQVIPSVVHNQPSAIDALLAFLLITPPSIPTSRAKTSQSIAADQRSLISILTFLSAEHPNPSFRTSAHHLATTRLHKHPSSQFRLATIKSTIKDCGPFDNLKEVAIGWLKEEILFTIPECESSPTISDSTEDDEDQNVFASPTLFSEDETLGSLLFPDSETPDPALTSGEEPSPPSTPTISNPQPAIASLNLLFLLLSNPTLKSRYDLAAKIASLQSSPSLTMGGESTAFEARALKFLTSMKSYVDENAGSGTKEEEGRRGLLGLAIGRVIGALEAYQREREEEEEEEEEQQQQQQQHQQRGGSGNGGDDGNVSASPGSSTHIQET